MSKPYAGLVRVSFMGGRKAGDDNVHTDREQVESIKRGVPQGARLTLLEPELDVSGGLPLEKRPSLLEAVEGIEGKRYAGIIVAYLSRLGRNTREQLAVWDRVEDAGGRIICVQDNVDTNSPSGRFMRTVLLANAEREREEHVERFDRLRQYATGKGIWQAKQTPRGYSRDPDTRRLVPNKEAKSIREIYRLTIDGIPASVLAHRVGMTAQGMRRLIANRVYLGELKWGAYVNPDAHPSLVTEDVWEAAQRVKVARPARTGDGSPALLAGLVKCAGCGYTMSRIRQAGGNYICHAGAPGQTNRRCPRSASIGLPKLDAYVTAIARQELSRIYMVAESNGGALRDARAAVADAQRELDHYLSAVQVAALNPEDYAQGARQRKEALTQTQHAFGVLHDREAITHSGDPVEEWERLDSRERNQLLRSMVEGVLVRGVGRGNRHVPVSERVRVIARGAGIIETDAGVHTGSASLSAPSPPWPDVSAPMVLRVTDVED